MKSLKKTLVLLVVFAMILSTVMPAFAASSDTYGLDCEEEVARLQALKIVKGYEDGTFKPENTITRAEMAVILCKMVGIDEVTCKENASVPSKFSDVAVNEWYTGYINVAAGKGFLSGFPDGTFRPNDQLTMNQVLTLCVNALGRGEYVSTMGAWPANYITEATKLGLLDGVKTSDANRGNVAMIVWNTLEAPYFWDVRSTEYEGTINLGDSGRSLLSIYFRDYTTKDGELKEFKDVKIAGANIEDSHLKLAVNADLGVPNHAEGKNEKEFVTDYGFQKKPSKNAKETSYRSDDNETVYIYVPEDVCDDIETLRNKTVTFILGDDNIAVLVTVEDEVIDTSYLTKYEDGKITIDGVPYKLAANYKVVVNDVARTYDDDLDGALTTELGIAAVDFDDIEKHVEATVIVDENDKVTFIELFASGTFGNTHEALVTKVKDSKTAYTITLSEDGVKKTISWDPDDEDKSFEYPKVYVDGAKGDIRDIVAGNVITVITKAGASDIKYNDVTAIDKIYVSTKTATGEPVRVKNSNQAITVGDEVYTRTKANVKMSKDELKETAFNMAFDADKILDNDEVTLYMNVLGEYVAITLEETETNYTFGIVTYVSDNVTFQGEDEEIAVRNIKVLMPDGSKPTYKVSVDTSDKDIDKAASDKFGAGKKAEEFIDKANLPIVGDFIMFEASDKTIEIEDGEEIFVPAFTLGDTTTIKDDYVFAFAQANSVDDEDFVAQYRKANATENIDADYDANKVTIFNTAEREIVAKWKSILTNDKRSLNATAFLVFEDEDDTTPLYIVVNIPENNYATSDSTYAIVDKSAYQEGSKQYVDFVEDSRIELKDAVVAPLTDIDGWLVEYAMSASKVSSAFKLIDALGIAKAKDTKNLADYVNGTLRPLTVGDPDVDTADALVASFADDAAKTAFLAAAGIDATKPATYTFTCTADDGDWDLDGTAITKANMTAVYGINLTGSYDADDTITITTTGSDTAFAWGATPPVKIEDIELDEVKVSSSGKITLVFKEIDGDSISNVKLDKDILKVYDLRNGTVEETTISAIKTEVADGESVYVIPAYNGDVEEDGANLLFIVK